MIRSLAHAATLLAFPALCLSSASAQTPAASSSAAPSIMRQVPESERTPIVSLSPAVIMGRGHFGETLSQTLTLSNGTGHDFPFEMVAQDVVVRDGARTFIPAGNLPNSIAQSAVFSQKTGVVKPYSNATVDVRLTIPRLTDIRAVVAIFYGTLEVRPSKAGVGMTASLGTLITFNLGEQVTVSAAPPSVSSDTDRSSVAVDQTLANTGAEPVVPSGVAAILTQGGKLMGKAPFEPQRLLPGERLHFKTEYAGQLPKGTYKVLCSFEFEGKQLTSSGNLRIE
jgi:hypothetical protein